ncbi:hypothetical protein PanWU01x14_240150 [Parasponia andersonii]|uniref:Uncharacterized protein n=1 Tax=Parasponia andersonii TaxID=3476 RepID=A0A2P5BGV6_PARAD|nr:hypothetical protein PanWU01x14_240150 [Parasponia andersonii]
MTRQAVLDSPKQVSILLLITRGSRRVARAGGAAILVAVIVIVTVLVPVAVRFVHTFACHSVSDVVLSLAVGMSVRVSVSVVATTTFVGTLDLLLWFGKALSGQVLGLGVAAAAVSLGLGSRHMGLAGLGLGLAAGLAGLLSVVVVVPLDPTRHLLAQRWTGIVFLLAGLVGGPVALQ